MPYKATMQAKKYEKTIIATNKA